MLEPPQKLIGSHHHKKKKRHHHHHHHAYPSNEAVHASTFWVNGCFWLLMLLLVGAFVAIIVVSYTVNNPHTPTYIVTTKKRHVVRSQTCSVGEHYDSELQQCAPNFHAPLAFDGQLMDPNVAACDDFYDGMCGRWNQAHTNENRAFTYGFVRNQHIIHKLISKETRFETGVIVPAPSSSALTDFYRSCLRATLNHGRNNKESILQMHHMLRYVLGDSSSLADVPSMWGRLMRYGYTTPLALSIERHPLEPRVVPFFDADSFPDTLDEAHIILMYRNTQRIHNLNILEVEQHVSAVASIMRDIRLHRRRFNMNYEAYMRSGVEQDMIRFDQLPQGWNVQSHQKIPGWHLLFQSMDGTGLRFHHDQQVWAFDQHYLEWLLNFGIAKYTYRDWRAFCEFSILYNGHDFAPSLPDNVYFKQHDRYGPLAGQLYHRMPRSNQSHTLAEDPETHCARLTQHLVPGLVGKAFLSSQFPQAERVKRDVQAILLEVLSAFQRRVRNVSWMSAVDKDVLLNKMNHTLVRVLEPLHWEAEPFAERISEDRYWHNLDMVRAYRVERNMRLWNRDDTTAFDRNALAYFLSPLTDINAYYSGPTNTVTVLAGVLQQPFFNLEYNDVSRYAILGTILGHELSHMADNHGLLWGANGSLHLDGILSHEGMRAFYTQSQCVAREFGPAPQGCLNENYGNMTLGEDLADLVGIQLAWDAYENTHPNPSLADAQHFFMVLTQAFCEHYDQAHLCATVQHDVHAVAMFRMNRSMRNLDVWQKRFSCHEGHRMWKAEGERCVVY